MTPQERARKLRRFLPMLSAHRPVTMNLLHDIDELQCGIMPGEPGSWRYTEPEEKDDE